MGENQKTVNYTDSQTKGDCDYIGNIVGQQNGFALVEMRGRFKKGEVLEVLSPSKNFGKSFTVEEVYTSKGELVEDCKLVQEVYKVKCPHDLSAGDILRRRKI